MKLSTVFRVLLLYVLLPIQNGLVYSTNETNPEETSSSSDASSDPNVSNVVNHQGLELVTLNDDETTSVNDVTKYDVKDLLRTVTVLSFKFHDGAKCVEVKHKDKKVWSRDDDVTPVMDNEKEYPLSVSYHQASNIVFIIFKERYLGYLVIKDEWVLKVNKENVKIETLLSKSLSDADKSETQDESATATQDEAADQNAEKETAEADQSGTSGEAAEGSTPASTEDTSAQPTEGATGGDQSGTSGDDSGATASETDAAATAASTDDTSAQPTEGATGGDQSGTSGDDSGATASE